ncbi:ABC transporter ATP-binding protein [Bartonella vinsonii]|uniref:Energy-coupling factor transporter ATP-binding protein EcfA2 n=1 Tax=Bartonella vinsonii TaxID=33047 RepID=A0A448V446_BARVI|nr:ABC transporter ATP-binding protein [Bartonella vinsonii]VEJ44556.1 Energy-coupling factor transporter ATP-binding protein EcfA2 [Bartonella vinsonii]
MIEFSHVGVTFKPRTPLEKQALIDLNLKIDRGSFVTIIGSNGAGKSTLLSVLAGAILPTEGKVIINGQNVSRQSISERAGKVACVFQDSLVGSCGSLTIEENLALAALRGSHRGLRSALNHKNRQFFRDKIAQLGIGLEACIHNPMDSLSGGQRQAVCLVMATLTHADVLLLDEHTSALDPGMADFVMQLTEKIVEEKKLTTIMVTHSMRQALDHGDRTLMLHGGKVILDVHQEERKGWGVNDLIGMFQKVRGEALDDDELLMD